MNEIKDRWDEIKEVIKNEYELSPVSFDTWIVPLKLHEIKDNVVKILIPSNQSLALNYINKNYKDFFQVTISEMMNSKYEVVFIIEKNNESFNEDYSYNNTYNINHKSANLNPKYTFDTFVVGNTNNVAHSAALAVAESPGNVYNPLFIYGGPGLGKTHLMHSIGHFILDNNPNMNVLYVTSEEFTNEVIDSIRNGDNSITMNRLRDKYRTVDVLMVDDVQFVIGKTRTQEEFFHTFNVLHTAGKQIILSSDRHPKEMETLDERFRSRFEWGLTVDIQIPDYETRMAILRKNVESSDIKVDDTIIQYIANNVVSNIRELEGAFNRIVAKIKANNLIEVTIEDAEDALKDIINKDNTVITPEIIIKAVADEFGVSVEDIKSSKRNAEIVTPRHVYMHICRKITDTSLMNIAKSIGKKDHTTVINGLKNIDVEIKENSELKEKINLIINRLNSQ